MQERSHKKISIISLVISAICLVIGSYMAGISSDESFFGAYLWHYIVTWGTLISFILCILWTVIVFLKERN